MKCSVSLQLNRQTKQQKENDQKRKDLGKVSFDFKKEINHEKISDLSPEALAQGEVS